MTPPGDSADGGPRPDPSPLLRLATVYWEAQIFLTANRIGLFTVLADGARDADAVAAELGTEPGRTALFLNACASLGLIEREPDGYRLSELSATFLVPGGLAFLGDAVRYGDDMYDAWGVLHRESAATCRSLIARAAEGLESGGVLVISDVFTDPDGTSPPFAALFGVNMMLSAPNGGVHADADVARWMKDEELMDVGTRPFPPPMPHRVLSGRKGDGP